MIVGFLPALGSGLGELARTGQAARLVDGYMRPYAKAFDGVRYFSYLPERLADFSDDPWLAARVRVLAPARTTSRARRAVSMVLAYGAELSGCAVLRVFQITGTVPALLARARFGVPFVTTYGFSYDALSRSAGRRLLKLGVERLALRHAALVLATTEALRVRAARRTSRVELLPNGVDTGRFVPAERCARAGGPATILYVGRLSAEKNLGALVSAAGRLRERVPLSLVLVGDGPERPALEAQAAAAGVTARFTGVVEQRALPAYYADADAFVLASFTEGHPKVLLEAMSSGVACVASSCEGNRSIVTDGDTGLLFDPARPETLAAALERVLGDRALAMRLGANGRALVAARYDLGRLVEREIALVRRVGAVATRGAAAARA
jgi:glycosyltransferase involved in cell wall biosynthesis